MILLPKKSVIRSFLKANRGYILNILLPIALGAVLYLWIKPNAWCAVFIRRILHIEKSAGWDTAAIPIFGYFIRHQLCDVLFAYSLTFALLWITGSGKRNTILAGIVGAAFEILIESAQLFGVISGNFDGFDIVSEVLVTIVIISIKLFIQRRKQNEKITVCPDDPAHAGSIYAGSNGKRRK